MKNKRKSTNCALGEDHEGWEDMVTDISQDITTDFKGYETLKLMEKF